MEGILNGLATLRSKKITIEIIIQSLAQLDAIYGKEQRQIITDNCAYKAILGATDSDTQKYFSTLVGTHEMQRESFTKDRKNLVFHDITSSNISIVDKPIIRPEEFAYLKDIVLLTPDGFSRVKKQPYYTMKGRKPLNPPVGKI